MATIVVVVLITPPPPLPEWEILRFLLLRTPFLVLPLSQQFLLQRLEPPRGAGWEPRGSRWRAASQAARSRCTES